MYAFGVLLFQVVGQQLSVKVTRTLLERLAAPQDGRLPTPEELLALGEAGLLAVGLSHRKAATLLDVARFQRDDPAMIHEWDLRAVGRHDVGVAGQRVVAARLSAGSG